MTAIFMVLGVFGAAVYTTDWSEDTTPQSAVAPGVLDKETSGVGEAPTCADTEVEEAGLINPQKLGDAKPQIRSVNGDVEEIPLNDVSIPLNQNEEPVIPEEYQMENIPLYQRIDTEYTPSEDSVTPSDHGTRGDPSAYVDAGPGVTGYEGWQLPFTASVYDPYPAGPYSFRWDVNDDGQWDRDWDTDPSYMHTFDDNHFGVARVQATDWSGYTAYGDVWDGDSVRDIFTYYSTADPPWTRCYEFTALKDCTINEIGFYRDYYIGYYYPIEIVNMKIYPTSGSAVRTVTFSMPSGTGWFFYPLSSPLTLSAGDEYKLSAYTDASPSGYPYDYMPSWQSRSGQVSDDGVIEVGDQLWALGDNNPTTPWTAWTPMFDMIYSYTETTILEDTTDVAVDNIAPLLSVEGSGNIYEGQDAYLKGYLSDPGKDTWEYRTHTGVDWSEWMPIGGYEFPKPLYDYNVLLYYDDPVWGARDFSEQALIELGLPYNKITTYTQLQAELAAPDIVGKYDLMIIDGTYWNLGHPTVNVLPDLYNLALGGQKMTYYCWSVYYGSPLYSYMGWSPYYYLLGMWTLYEWDTSHPIFNFPNDVPTMTMDMWYWFYVGQGANVVAPGHEVAGWNPGPGGPWAGLINRPDKQTIWNGFCANHFGGDADGDGDVDMKELYVNEIIYLLEGEPISAWPDPLEFDILAQFPDDHPTTITPEDLVNVKVQVRDDDHDTQVILNEVGVENEDFETYGSYPGWPIGWYEYPHYYRPYWYRTTAAYGSNMQGYHARHTSYRSYYTNDELRTEHYNIAGITNLIIDWDNYWQCYYQYSFSRGTGYIEYRLDNTGPWYILESWTQGDPNQDEAHYQEMIDVTGHSDIQFRFRFYNKYYGPRWEFDNFVVRGGTPYVMYGLGEADTDVYVKNVPPTAFTPDDFVDLGDEPFYTQFNGFYLEDPALKVDTENFWYRWIWDDGLQTPWAPTGAAGPQEMMDVGTQATTYTGITRGFYFYAPVDFTIVAVRETTDASSGVMSATVLRMHDDPTAWRYPSLSNNFDVLGLWQGVPGTGPIDTDIEIKAGELIMIMGCRGTNSVNSYGVPNYMTSIAGEPVELVRSGMQYNLYNTAPQNIWNEPPYPISRIEVYYQVGGKGGIPDTVHRFGDNGIYNVDLQLIDDDMLWDTSGPQPVFTGDPDEEWDWISHHTVPVEVYNVDPVINRAGISATSYADLGLRMAGTKSHEATLILYEDGAAVDSVTVYRDPGKPDTGFLGGKLYDMTPGTEYEIHVTCTPESGNPTWIFETSFPDGKFKELHHTFSEGHGWTWVITNDMFKEQFVGADIYFAASAYESGTDDLTFLYTWGDGMYGVNVYSSWLEGTAFPGTVVPAEDLNNVLPDNIEDDDFTQAANDMRTPHGISERTVNDVQVHVFDEPGYYYVSLAVIDDDIHDGYPSAQLFWQDGGCDMEFVEIDL
jgi:hypothetical protein